jgi:ribosomal protein S18 acetylase RimI-like enzyme
MNSTMTIKFTTSQDIRSLQIILDKTGLFPSEMLPEMLREYISQGYLASDNLHEVWLTCFDDGNPIGFCYAKKEALTDAAWNMLAIAVDPDVQGRGFGTVLVQELEAFLCSASQYILLAETSGVESFELTRKFYHKAGYFKVGQIPDFWALGDDKVIFCKKLQSNDETY